MAAVEHFVDAEHSLVITVCSSYVTKTDVVASLTSLRKDPKFKPSFAQLINLMQTAKLDLDFKDLVGIREVYDPFSIESRRAVAAHSDGVAFALARMYQAIVDTDRFEVFPSLLEAISWLGLEATILEAAVHRSRYSSNDSVVAAGTTVLDLPAEVPASFRPIRRKLKKAAGNRKS
jgi:hypothetical protein